MQPDGRQPIQPWASCGRAAAIDNSHLRARGDVRHKKDREKGIVPHTTIDIQAHWTKSGRHGWFYGWQLHVLAILATVWIPLAADLTAANAADNEAVPGDTCSVGRYDQVSVNSAALCQSIPITFGKRRVSFPPAVPLQNPT